ncbi:MAG TPA: V-type ATPase 116kDa subunit family protein, partial [Candidatus Paceibacterota bacterium]|nr:V-type ATPase 116kDa subunit family protein [Candidatus Paceibacterota bacterium]
MAVCKVKKVNIFTHIELKNKIIEELHKVGCVQIIDVTSKLKALGLLEFNEINDIESNYALAKVKYCIDFLSNFKDKSKKSDKSLATPDKVYDYNKLSSLFFQYDYKKIYEKCIELEGNLKILKTRENHLKNIQEQLEEWKELDLKIEDLEGTKNTEIIAGTLPSKDFVSCLDDLKKIGKEIEINKISEDKKQSKIIILSMSEYHSSIKKILSKYNISYFSPALEFNGTPRSILKDIFKELINIEEKRKLIFAESIKLHKENLWLYIAFDYLSILKNKKDIDKYIKQTKKVIFIEGWVLKKDLDELKNTLYAKFKELEIVFSDPEEGEDIPVALKNNKFVEPFESVTALYGIPKYREYDPTPLFAPFYFIFFGMCLSDAGYGLIIAALSYFALLKFKFEGMIKKFFGLFFLGGISTFIMGTIMG